MRPVRSRIPPSARRYAFSLLLLLLPSLLTLAVLGKAPLNPLISLSYLLAIAAAGWLFGLGPGLFTVAASIVSLTVIGTHGRQLIPPRIDYAATVALVLVAVLASRVAAFRHRVEEVLRSANDRLEASVRQRTAELDRARESLQITIESIGDAVIATAADGAVSLMNGVAQALTGWPRHAALGRPLEEVFRIVNEETRAPVENPVAKVLRAGSIVGLANHTVLLSRDGREIPIDDSAAPIRSANGELAGVVLIFRDIAGRRQAERERDRLLRETAAARAEAEYQRGHLQSLLQQAPVSIDILRGPEHVFDFVHPLTRRRLGRDVSGLPLRLAFPHAESHGFLRLLDEVYRTGVPYVGKEISVRQVGWPEARGESWFDITLTRWLDPRGAPAGIISVAADVTVQVRSRQALQATEEGLRETAKLESLGVLAGGIAHDFNNLLVGILGSASLAREMIPPGDPAQDVLADVVGAGEKAALLTRQMLAYSGKGRMLVEPVDLSLTIREILPLVSGSIPPSVSFHLQLATGLPAIEADPAQLHQVVMNLLINGAEACGNRPGTVHVSTSAGPEDAASVPPLFGIPPVQPGTFVCLEVRDTGSGMSDEVKAKIFDPFFTTKFTGRGLGLSATLGIIRSHRGGIQLTTAPGQGTTFRIYFPAAATAHPEPIVHASVREPSPSGTILVVDDEEMVRKTARLALERRGYRVLTAANGAMALDLFRDPPGRISLVILDLTMPVLGGDDTLDCLQQFDPAVKVLLSSGYSIAEAAERFAGRGLAGFLQKPYTTQSLSDAVQAALQPHHRASPALG